MAVSCLCLSADHAAFYVGYAFSGVVEKYSLVGLLLSAVAAHDGDVRRLALVRRGVVCSSGSDGLLRLLDMSCSAADHRTTTHDAASSGVMTETDADAAAVADYSPDELAYRQVRRTCTADPRNNNSRATTEKSAFYFGDSPF